MNTSPPTGDSQTTVAELKSLVAQFVAERDWSQFHSPKNLSMAIAIEAAELMEHFQWLEPGASRLVAADEQRLSAVGEEIADVVAYAMALANELGLDLASTIKAKMVKNHAKYPAGEFRGRYSRDQRPS
jgi:NTP pyrophosphatase (non-canonical NTP hydrolase)